MSIRLAQLRLSSGAQHTWSSGGRESGVDGSDKGFCLRESVGEGAVGDVEEDRPLLRGRDFASELERRTAELAQSVESGAEGIFEMLVAAEVPPDERVMRVCRCAMTEDCSRGSLCRHRLLSPGRLTAVQRVNLTPSLSLAGVWRSPV